MEIMGFVLWEGLTLLLVLLAGLGVLIIRRKASGRPIFTRHDWVTYFGDLQVRMSKPRLALRLSYAAFICSLVVIITGPVLARMGPGLYSVTIIFACLGIVKLTLR
ncbi:MAG: hypothetical protein HYU31_11460 [Deltaproteobacteria bacterium]|nr:hypothetical protein [Deltaproteobacteria bacterium]MBI2230853.1 hypothetical protein [Deltaproteobacteria bacterium]MBI3063504.1 hypothetical protein [Deltaproteobacteria bacterium]